MRVTNVPPMSASDFRAWRKSLGFTQIEAAGALSLSERAIKHYEAGSRGISPQLALHCAAIARRNEPGIMGRPSYGPRPNDIATPLHACQRLYDIISPHYQPRTILDPSAGDGRLTAPWKSARVISFEIKSGTDFFAAGAIPDVDLVLCNPPFNGISYKQSRLGAEAFLIKIIEVVGHVPTVLFATMGFRLNAADGSRRAKMLANLHITSIMSLPFNFFPGTQINAEVLFFNMPRLEPHYMPSPVRRAMSCH
jgi:transcriptional regulator with XRE-family HTH domain